LAILTPCSSTTDSKFTGIFSDDERSLLSPVKTPRVSSRNSRTGESGSDSGGRSRDRKRDHRTENDSTPRPLRSIAPKSSQSSLRPKAAPTTGTKNMTVETETVNSVAQATLNPPDRTVSGRAEPSGTLKVKASNETIRPKKERKKASRKAPSVNAGTGRSSSRFSSSLQSRYLGQSYGQRMPLIHHHHHRGVRPADWPRYYASLKATDSSSTASKESFESMSAPSTPFFARKRHRSHWPFYRTQSANHRLREASSRADIFEGQVLDAMDQATSDDSDETFVYESNPPEPPPQRNRGRNHSRTPSATSMTSLGDQQRPGLRSIAGVLDPQRSMQKSRSMKFVNNAYGSGADDDLERQNGTIRAHRNGGSSVHHHHLGRHSRHTTGPTSILDDDNPTFPALNKPRSLTGMAGRQTQNARMAAQNLRSGSAVNKREIGYSSYDMDDEPADDERTPLVGTVRGPRSGPRTPRSTRQRYPNAISYPRHRRSILSRFAGCIVLIVMLLLLAFGVVGFLFAISKPLTDVRIIEIEHVLASEQEIMLDLVVEAVNQNLLPINIADMDVNIFAKSKYVGSEKWWRDHPNLPASEEPLEEEPLEEENFTRRRRYRSGEKSERDGGFHAFDDDSSDPPRGPPKDDDSAGNKQTMLLGHVYKFDNPLSFDGSFWRRHSHYSTGSLRLNQPGNKTELGGTERWERVLQHPFNLVVRGVLKYSIPLGGSKFSTPVNAEILVHPEKNIEKDIPNLDQDGRLKLTQSKRDQVRLRFARPAVSTSCSENLSSATKRPLSFKERIFNALLV
jgi:Vacuolar segregation subunit 7